MNIEQKIIRNKTPEETREFIRDLLTTISISPKYINIFTDDESMKIFMKVFTHPSADPVNNYEILEYIGDGIIKGILSQYIPRRFPDLTTSEGKLSKVRRSLEQNKTLSKFALDLGFWDYVVGDEETMNQKRNKTLEDVYEAFIGALVEIIDMKIKRGIGYKYAQDFVEFSLDKHPIQLTEETLDDPITRLNELYTAKELKNDKILKWGFPKYTFQHVYIPIVNDLSNVKVSQGTVVYNPSTRSIFVGFNNKLIPISNLNIPIPLLFSNVTHEYAIEHPDMYQRVRHSQVYAKPIPDIITYSQSYNFIPIFNKELQQIVIGHGLSFNQKDSKKMAAQHAINYLKSIGYEKK